ncbi:MAG: hypothetical protein HZA91_12670 [Verrucomicrobia bacterium]|nr:hypothetical protein [Verrucomicrobiota bacterium]
MAILQSIDGRFYQIPDDEADKCLVPADKVEETLRAAGAAQPQAAAAPGAGGMPVGTAQGPVIIYVVGGGGGAPGGGMPMGPGPQQQMGAPMGQQQVQAYAHHHHGHHGGHHGGWGGWGGGWGGWGGGWGGCTPYSNYSNYSNWGCW